jgi:predicted dehydrogenase
MGRRHLRAYGALRRVGAGGFEIVAVCDPRSTAAEGAADLAEELLGRRPVVFSGYEQLIASGIANAVDVVTDPASHHLIAVPALEAGVHVMCEKPLGLTVRACREMVDAAARSGAVLATAENYRRDGGNRLARAVLDKGLLGDVHLMTETNIGGDNAVIISPWRHVRESGSIALDMGVHYTDLFRYYLGDLEAVYGSAFIAEPLRVLAAGGPPIAGINEVSPGFMRATGEDSLVALYQTAAGALVQLAFVPSGPGRQWAQRSVHGRAGSMSIPRDRSGGAVVVQLGDRTLTGGELRHELGDFRLEGVAASFFGAEGTEYDLAFAEVDAATIGIEIDDFVHAIEENRAPEVDGLAGLLAVAGVWAVSESQHLNGAVRIADVTDGTISTAQGPLDLALGLPRPAGARA